MTCGDLKQLPKALHNIINFFFPEFIEKREGYCSCSDTLGNWEVTLFETKLFDVKRLKMDWDEIIIAADSFRPQFF